MWHVVVIAWSLVSAISIAWLVAALIRTLRQVEVVTLSPEDAGRLRAVLRRMRVTGGAGRGR